MAASKQIFNDLNLVIRLNQHIEDIASSDEAAAALLAKQTSFKVLAELDAIQNPDPRADAQFDHQRQLSEPSDKTDHALPFHLQGDEDFNRASAIAERRALRRSDAIKHKVQFLWDVARGQKQADIARSGSRQQLVLPGAARASANVIEERDYMAMMLLIFKVLRDDFVLEMAQLQVQCDWEVDSHHSNALAFDQFFAAVFELVDLWTCDIAETTYARFLELLIRRITLRVVIFLDDMKLKLALSDNFDDAVVVKAIPLSTIQRFASVAKVVERRGVRTVGDLASADPRMVETERLAFLERNNISKEKIGTKLQHLLDTFNGLSEQLHGGGARDRDQSGADANVLNVQYSLENMKLVRHVLPVDGDRTSSGSALLSGASPLASSSATRLGTDRSTVAPAIAGGGHETRSARSATRRLSIHDLSKAESGIINSLRSAFILEKRISIVRKHDIDAVREELEKFGVDPTPLSDIEVFDKYGGLYEMFVLRDGESIKALAQTMLTQIKLELQAHGVTVDDEDAEARYDDFYGSVVATSGEAIVQDAQKWVDATVDTNNVASYLKADYHELKPLEQVALIGSQAGDDEFVALLSNEEDDESNDDAANGSAKELADVPAKPKNGSPIQRKQSQMRLKAHAPPPIQTNARSDASHTSERRSSKPERPVVTPPRTPVASAAASPRRRSGPRADHKASDDASQQAAVAAKRKASKEHADAHTKQHTAHPPATSQSARERQQRRSVSSCHDTEPPSVEDIAAATESTERGQESADASASGTQGDSDTASAADELQAPTASDDDDDDDAARLRALLSLNASRSKSSLDVEMPRSDLEASDTANNDVDREAQGVAFGYDDEPAPVLEPEPVAHETYAVDKSFRLLELVAPLTCLTDARLVLLC